MSKNKWIEDLDDLDTPSESEQEGVSITEWIAHLGQVPYIAWIGAGVVGLLLVLGLTLFWGDAEQPKADATLPQSVVARLDSLDQRISDLASQVENLRHTTSGGSQSETLQDLGIQLQNLENSFNRYKKETNSHLASLQSKVESASTASRSKPAPRTESSAATYTVKKGDNLYRIGLKFNVSVDTLRAWNNLKPSSEIYPGQKLRVSAP